MNTPRDDDGLWFTPVLNRREQAIENGTLIPYQFPYQGEMIDCCLSQTLWEQYRACQTQLKQICQKGWELLAHPDLSDTDQTRKRVIVKNAVWGILDRDGIIYFTPQEAIHEPRIT